MYLDEMRDRAAIALFPVLLQRELDKADKEKDTFVDIQVVSAAAIEYADAFVNVFQEQAALKTTEEAQQTKVENANQ